MAYFKVYVSLLLHSSQPAVNRCVRDVISFYYESLLCSFAVEELDILRQDRKISHIRTH